MISFIKRMWAAAPIATVILAIALALSVFFAARTTASWIYWNDPAHQDQPIAGWMTGRYVALSWDVPRNVMMDALQIDGHASGPRNLGRLAKERSIPLDVLIADIEAAIAKHRAAKGEKQTGGSK